MRYYYSKRQSKRLVTSTLDYRDDVIWDANMFTCCYLCKK